MRDVLREQDLERALNVRGGVRVDVADDGTTLVTLQRDLLDRLTEGNPGHYGCHTYDDVEFVRARAYGSGYDAALADINRLAAGSTA